MGALYGGRLRGRKPSRCEKSMLAAHRDSAITVGLLDRRASPPHSSSPSPELASRPSLVGEAALWSSEECSGPGSPLCRSMRKLSISTFKGLSSRYEVDPSWYFRAGWVWDSCCEGRGWWWWWWEGSGGEWWWWWWW